MQRRTLASWLVSSALVCFGFFLWAGTASAQEATVVQGQNGSNDSDATSESAQASNDLTFQAGPQAGGEDAPAQAAQNGDNAGTISQGAEAKSGDASAGSQVHGSVGSGHTVQGQNTSDGATATSAPATATNTGDYELGPQAVGIDAEAQSSQVGDNRLDASQSVMAHSGDAVAGSQVTGIVGDGDHTIQNQNAADDSPEADSGSVDASNDAEMDVGPSGVAIVDEAQASQVGDNDAVLVQSNEATSGDAVAGSQVTGVAGDGSSTVQEQSSSTNADADTGDVESVNTAAVNVGPFALSILDPAQSSQVGDNAAEIDQAVRSGSGDAVAGSQVTGLVTSEAGHVTVQNQQSSEDDTAVTGTVGIDATANDVDTVQVGPVALSIVAEAQATQNGDSSLVIGQSADLASGDAVAGSQVTGAIGGDGTVQNQNDSVGSFATSGDVATDADVNEVDTIASGPVAIAIVSDASAAQVGDNDLSIDQSAALTSGDAVAGGQVTGIVANSSATVQNQNSTEDADATSGDVGTNADVNDVEETVAGPFALGIGDEALASQIGDNGLAIDQSADLASGDAIAGAQVTGIVVNSDATVQNQNTCSVDDVLCAAAQSGDVGTDGADINDVDGVFVGGAAIGDEAPAEAAQNGSNDVFIGQSADLASGDAVAGAQVTGIVASGGSEVTVQNQNESTGADSVSGDAAVEADVNSVSDVIVGPEADADSSGASAAQVGDNAASIDQAAVATSGDAVAGSQVTGVVASGGDVTVQLQNVSDDSDSTTGDVDPSNEVDDVNVGPAAFGNDTEAAEASQIGDNGLVLSQTATASSGDAVAGAQVVGAVEDDSTVQLQNFDDGSDAETFDADADNFASGNVGPLADADEGSAMAGQVGDSALAADQVGDASTGDALAGGQVVGVVGTGAGALDAEGGAGAGLAGEGSFEIASAATS